MHSILPLRRFSAIFEHITHGGKKIDAVQLAANALGKELSLVMV
ncbi:hypothetical protein HMPREF9530_03968 [Escherichia coli MS 21-1]|nr:hypothetical protein HMPREF9530_03968 [Escherichia coli MS 21-1]